MLVEIKAEQLFVSNYTTPLSALSMCILPRIRFIYWIVEIVSFIILIEISHFICIL